MAGGRETDFQRLRSKPVGERLGTDLGKCQPTEPRRAGEGRNGGRSKKDMGI